MKKGVRRVHNNLSNKKIIVILVSLAVLLAVLLLVFYSTGFFGKISGKVILGFGETQETNSLISEGVHFDKVFVSKFTLTENAYVSGLSVYGDGKGSGTGTQQMSGIIYSHNPSSSIPQLLQSTTNPISVLKGASKQWLNMNFETPVFLVAGDYWLGIQTGNSPDIIRYYYTSSTGAMKEKDDAYSDGPTIIFSASEGASNFVTTNKKMWIKVVTRPTTTTPTSGGEIITFGQTTPGDPNSLDLLGLEENKKYVTKFDLPQSGSVTKLSGYVKGGALSSSENQKIRGIIYSNNNNTPNQLLGITNELFIPLGLTPGWADMNFETPVFLVAGSYWLGFISGGGVSHYRPVGTPNPNIAGDSLKFIKKKGRHIF